VRWSGRRGRTSERDRRLTHAATPTWAVQDRPPARSGRRCPGHLLVPGDEEVVIALAGSGEESIGDVF